MSGQFPAWLTVAGLTLDFLGFLMLLREWWIAFLSEASLMAHEEALERQQKLRSFAAQTASEGLRQHMARVGEMQDDMSIRRGRDELRNAMRGRRFWFVSAGVLIILGFLFQIAGTIPI